MIRSSRALCPWYWPIKTRISAFRDSFPHVSPTVRMVIPMVQTNLMLDDRIPSRHHITQLFLVAFLLMIADALPEVPIVQCCVALV